MRPDVSRASSGETARHILRRIPFRLQLALRVATRYLLGALGHSPVSPAIHPSAKERGSSRVLAWLTGTISEPGDNAFLLLYIPLPTA
jgi:hypothetical protein